jgi:hypothetical protein
MKISASNSLASLNPKLAKEWHPTKNGNLTPNQIGIGSGKKAWWICSKDNSHEWQAVIASRAKSGHGCPFCSGRLKINKNLPFAFINDFNSKQI